MAWRTAGEDCWGGLLGSLDLDWTHWTGLTGLDYLDWTTWTGHWTGLCQAVMTSIVKSCEDQQSFQPFFFHQFSQLA